ncbi:MAG: hypothetical protein Q7T70_02785 [Polaromonas sp.]|nr:hypothetical protein [Polaromonas sp.]
MRETWFPGEAEQHLLLELLGSGLSHAEIKALTGASMTSIVTYRKRLGFTPGKRIVRWSEAEAHSLLSLIKSESKREVAAILGRSEKSVDRKLSELGAKRSVAYYPKSGQDVRWSEPETRSLLSLIESKSNREVAAILGRSKKSVDHKLSQLGAKRSAAYHMKSGQPFRLYPPELREAMALQKAITRKLNDVKEHG